MDAAAVQTLIELLNDGKPGVVLEAIVLLGRIKDPRARRALTATMESQQPLLQCHAIEALGQLADSKSLGLFARLLDDPHANVRVTAAAALAKMGSDKNTVAPLVKALKDPDADVVIQAARGLGESGDKRAAGPLSRLLHSAEERVRTAAALALAHLGDARSIPQLLLLVDADNEEGPLKALAALRILKKPEVAGELLGRLNHPIPAIRRRLVDVLGIIGDAEVAERLEQILRSDPVEEVRATAARALGQIADPASVEALKHSLENDPFNVRCQAIAALGQIGDEECYSILVPLLADPVLEIRYHAAMALGEAGNKKVIPLLKDLLKDKNAMVVRGAAKALEKLGVSDVESELRKARRSKQMRALREFGLSLKSWWPDSVQTQKMLLGGSLAAVLLIGVVGWLVTGLFAEPPARVVVRGNVQTLSFTSDGQQIAVGRTLGLVEIWDASSGKLDQKFTPAGGSKLAAILPPETLALVGRTGIQLWQKSPEIPPRSGGHSKPITRFVTTPDQSFAATLGSDGQAILWDLNTGRERASLNLPATETLGFAVSADGELFSGGNAKGQVTIWKTSNSEKLTQLAGPRAAVASSFHPDGKTLAVAYPDQIIIWNSETREKIATLDKAQGLTALQYHPQGTQLAGLRGAMISIWDTSALKDSKAVPKTISVQADQIDAWTFSRDGSKLAVGGTEDSAVWIYDTATGELLKTLDAKP
jgi:HEAT repeat protein